MKTKYFRFLYTVTKLCFIHFGEVKDTKKDETTTFLYLKKALSNENGREAQGTEKAEKQVFLCPDHVDLAVLGSVDADVLAELENLLRYTKIETLVVPASAYGSVPEQMEGIKEILWLGGTEEIQGQQKQNQKGRTIQTADHLERTTAGWRILVKAWGKENLAMLHTHEATESRNNTIPYEDIVMSIKNLDEEKRCRRNACPDEFGCALGCVLHQDYDLCKYRNTEKPEDFFTGTLLLAGPGKGEGKGTEVLEEAAGQNQIRFFAADFEDVKEWERLLPAAGSGQAEPKRYYVGTGMKDEVIAAICRSGFQRVPVALQEGSGICCSGLMKYTEQ